MNETQKLDTQNIFNTVQLNANLMPPGKRHTCFNNLLYTCACVCTPHTPVLAKE